MLRILLPLLLSALLALAAPLAPALAAGISQTVETSPKTDLNAYLVEGKLPRYIRINVPGYNIRTTPSFRDDKTDNIDFTTSRGAMFAVRRMVPLANGVAVNVFSDGEDRWVYVPDARRQDFQFCESEGCFSDLAMVLKFLQDQNITPENLAECGLALDAQGKLIEPRIDTDIPAVISGIERSPVELEGLSAAIPEEKRPEKHSVLLALPAGKDAPIPTPRPEKVAKAEPKPEPKPKKELLASASRPRVSMLWESSRPDGRQWTNILSQSLNKYGRDLINRTSLADQKNWCPNYDKLNSGQRKEFWGHLLNGIARYESGFKTGLTFDERTKSNPRSGLVKPDRYSQGLFQLSYKSAEQSSYGNFCRFDYQRDRRKDISNADLTIYDVKKQMDCAVGILNYWVKKDGGVGFGGKRNHRGGARFWSTLRSNNGKARLVRATLRRFTPCGLK